MIIPTPALIERVSSAKQLFWTTLKSNFKTRLRYTLKHLDSMHDPKSHGNWSKGAGMYGGKVGLVGKVRQRLGGVLGSPPPTGGGGKSESWAEGMARAARERNTPAGTAATAATATPAAQGAPTGQKRGGSGRPLTPKQALEKLRKLNNAEAQPGAITRVLLGSKGSSQARAALEEMHSRVVASLKDKPKELEQYSRDKKNSDAIHATRMEDQTAKVYNGLLAKVAGNKKLPATLRQAAKNAQSTAGEPNSMAGRDFINQYRALLQKRGELRTTQTLTGKRASERNEENRQIAAEAAEEALYLKVLEDKDFATNTAKFQKGQGGRKGDPTANDAMFGRRTSGADGKTRVYYDPSTGAIRGDPALKILARKFRDAFNKRSEIPITQKDAENQVLEIIRRQDKQAQRDGPKGGVMPSAEGMVTASNL